MKTIIAGSRKIDCYEAIEAAIQRSGFEITEIISGGAKGADQQGEAYGKSHGIPVKVIKTNWKSVKGGVDRVARFKNNSSILEYADALIAVWDGESPEIKVMTTKMRAAGKKVFVFWVKVTEENGETILEWPD